VTGISHIIAVSGFNITIIILAITSLAQIIGRKNSVWLAAFAIVAFVIICGASASVVRAAIMGSLLLISLSLGRQYSVAPALFFAALVMLAVNPKILFWDVGFQLSFAATLGIIYFMPVLGKLAQNLPEDFGLKTLILTTLSAILATMPLIILNFGIISLSAPIVNMLVVPAVPWSMLFGFLTALPFVGSGSALVANWILLYILKVVSVFAGLPYSSLNAQIGPWIFWLLVLAVLGLYYLLALLAKDRPVEENSQP
jgi:competence protein ComEC